MKALTLRQPWAGAVCDLGKRLENRKRPPPRNLAPEEMIAIHAGRADTRATEAEHRDLTAQAASWGMTWASRASVTFGCVVAVCRVAGWLEVAASGELKRWRWDAGKRTECPWVSVLENPEMWVEQTRQVGRWWQGPCAWELVDLHVLPEPVPARGALGLWRLPEDVELAVRAQLAEVPT